MLHEHNALWRGESEDPVEDFYELAPDLKGIRRGTARKHEEARRLGETVLALFDVDEMDSSRLVMAVVKAVDIARPIPACARCEHSLGDHAWLSACEYGGCDCAGYTQRCIHCKHLLTDHGLDGKCGAKGCSCSPRGKGKAPEASTGATSGSRSRAASVAPLVSSGA
jgi:hypothetical protein